MTAATENEPRAGSEAVPTIATELSLVAVTATLAFAICRAFTTWEPLWTLLGIAVAAHLVALTQRRLRVPALVATALSLALGVVVISFVHYRGLSWYGLPTKATFDQALNDASTSFGPFKKLVPPVSPTLGFEVSLAVAIWLIATFADLAAFRADAPLQAVVAHIAGFVFSSVLVLGRSAEMATVAFAVALSMFALAVRSDRAARRSQRGTADALNSTGSGSTGQGSTRQRPSGRWIWRYGTPMVLMLIVAALVITPIVPRPSAERLVDLRALGRGPSSRLVESPLVSLDAWLGAESNAVMFTVQSSQPHYWRLTSLDNFNGRSWAAKARYQDIDSGDELAGPFGRSAPTQQDATQFVIKDLRSDWLPSAFAPTSVTSPISLRYDTDSSSLFVNEDGPLSGTTYTVRTEALDVTNADQLTGREPGSGDELNRYLDLPDDFNPRVAALARQIMGKGDPFTAAQALEDYFADFVYDRQANFSGSVDPLAEFLRERRGFCQQFATAFAAMARSVGIPSRVAVGFTYGDVVPSQVDAPDEPPTWTVRGRHAHAWPEINIAGIGWVAFEPTPGRGNPDSTGFSGDEPQQADDSGGTVSGTGAPTTTTATPTSVASTPTTALNDEPARNRPQPNTPEAAPSTATRKVTLAIIIALIGIGLGAALRIWLVRRRDRRLHDPAIDPATRIAESWRRTCADLARIGVYASAAETPAEFAGRAGPAIEVEPFGRLGAHETNRRYRPSASTAAEASESVRISDQVRAVVWARLGRVDALRARLDLDPPG